MKRQDPCQTFVQQENQNAATSAQTLLKPRIQDPGVVKAQLEEYRKSAKTFFDRGAKPLQPLKENEEVRVRSGNAWLPA